MHPAENLRLSELRRYDVVLSREEEAYTELATLVARHFGAPIAGISLVDDEHVWLKGRHGVTLDCLNRDGAFCSYAIESNQELFEVARAQADARFRDNALVTNAPNVRSYFAATLTGQRGYPLGTLWFMDTRTRELSEDERQTLLGYGAHATRLLELRYRSGESGLPSRSAFVTNLQCALTQGSGGSQACRIADCSRLDNRGRCSSVRLFKPVTVGYIQLRNMPLIHSLYGRERGEQLVHEFVARLREWCTPGDMLGHVDGDHFAFALFNHRQSPEERLRELKVMLARPFAVQGEQVFVTTSVGLAQGAAVGAMASSLLDEASAAAALAPDSLRTSVQVYDVQQREASMRQLELARCVEDCIAGRAVRPSYQAQVDVIAGRVVGFEALARMQHDRVGLIMPNDFMEPATRSGQIQRVDLLMLEAVCRDLSQWRQAGLPLLPVAVNFSRITLVDKSTPAAIQQLLQAWSIAPELISIEVTESGFTESPEGLRESIAALKGAGLAIALDDFGTGLSNLDALRSLAFDCLKADRAYVHGAAANGHGGAIMRLIHGMAELFGARLICEGVEDEADLRWSMALGCRYFQGWFFARDTGPEGVARMLSSEAETQSPPAGDPIALARRLQGA